MLWVMGHDVQLFGEEKACRLAVAVKLSSSPARIRATAAWPGFCQPRQSKNGTREPHGRAQHFDRVFPPLTPAAHLSDLAAHASWPAGAATP